MATMANSKVCHSHLFYEIIFSFSYKFTNPKYYSTFTNIFSTFKLCYMSDALTDSYQLDLESKAELDYLESLIEYLFDPTSNKKEILNFKKNHYISIFKGGDISRGLEIEISSLEQNNPEFWREFSQRRERDLFLRRPNLKSLFLSAGQKRRIGRLQWVI